MCIGLNNIFFNILYIKVKGNIVISNVFLNIFLIKVIIVTFILMIYELNNIIYTNTPINTPRNINNLISPLLNTNVEYKNIKPC